MFSLDSPPNLLDIIECLFLKSLVPALDLLYGLMMYCLHIPNAITHDFIGQSRLDNS